MVVADRVLRKIVPSTAILSRWPGFSWFSRFLDLFIRPYLRPFTSQPIPPLRLIVRTGVANNLLFPHYYYLTASANIWIYFFSQGLVTLESHIVDIGSGIGKSAVALRDFSYLGEKFQGLYYGFDIDSEMVGWCQKRFPHEHFRFTLLDMNSKVYNPSGSSENRPRLSCDDNTIDLVFSQSLFSHLLENEIHHYISESFRTLKPGGTMLMTFFCKDDLEKLGLLGGRWRFENRLGSAYVENINYPESAVAYSKDWMLEVAEKHGFSQAQVILPAHQSTLKCVK